MRIIWSEPALADLEAIHEFIARDSRQYATRFVQRSLEAAERHSCRFAACAGIDPFTKLIDRNPDDNVTSVGAGNGS